MMFARANLLDQRVHGGGAEVVHGHRVTSGDQVARHGAAHGAQTDEADFHVVLSFWLAWSAKFTPTQVWRHGQARHARS